MKTLPIASIVVLAQLLCACSSHPPKDDPSWSRALRIARAAGFKDVRDVDPAKLTSLDPNTGSTFEVAEALGTATGILAPTPGIPSPVEALLILAGAGAKPRPEDKTRLIAWMPASEAATREEAAAKMVRIWTQAAATALPDAKVELVEDQRWENPKLVKAHWYRFRYIKIDKPGCDKCAIRGPVIDLKSSVPMATTAPAFLGGQPAWFWGGLLYKKGASNYYGYPESDESLTAEQRLDYLTRFSAALPAWAFVYVAPEKEPTRGPRMLDHGEVLRFRQKETAAPAK